MSTVATPSPAPTVITISPDGTVATVRGVNAYGVTQTWTLSPQRLGELLSGLQHGGERLKWLDLLGVSTPGVASTTTAEWTYVVLAFPRRIVEMRRQGSAVNQLLPALSVSLPPSTWILRFSLREDQLRGSWFMLSSTPIRSVTDVTPVIAFPLGNVYDGSANLCWGNVVTSQLRPSDPMAVDHLFFSTPFNTDLARPQNLTGHDGTEATAWRDYAGWGTWQSAHPGGELRIGTIGIPTPFATRLAGIVGEQVE